MADNLIIVESPAKANTIKKFTGGRTKVLASQGHIRDLPKSKLGVNIEDNFEPEYINIRGKAELIKSLKKEAKDAKKVILATDPDREGEAIAWHLAHILDIDEDSMCRVTFNEITKEAVTKAIKNPRKLDKDLIDAQQARRVLDRILGYKLSPILWKKVKKGLSGGRVQSVAVKLIVDREEEIKNFITKEYWNIYATLSKLNKKFKAKLYGKDGKKIEELSNESQVLDIIKDIENAKYIVDNIKRGEKKKTPAPPFITSTMQQEASRKLGFTLKKTMSVAQGLYEGVNVAGHGQIGLITYMRTDSVRVAEEARGVAKTYIEKTYGAEYYENRYYKTNKASQDAHEAIRPTYIDLSPDDIKESLTPDQYKLYKLIHNRFIASQMAAAIYDTITVEITANTYNFRASGQTLKFKGFMCIYIEETDTESEEENENIPELEEKEEVKKEDLEKIQSFTEPPPRYTEATLVKTLEENGIGRPSTYAPTITTILDRRYIEKDKKQLYPTELGTIVNGLLTQNFKDIVNVEFTANIEKEFDDIEEGKAPWKQIIEAFYGPFIKSVEKAEKELEHVVFVEEVSDVPCDKCGKMMVVKFGKFGKFLACPGFPECKNTKPILITIDEPCPKCGGKIAIRKTKNRRNYYICENNPASCDYISWNKPGEEEKEKKPKTSRKKAKK